MALRKLLFFWKNHFDTATVTATSENPDFPVENLQDRWATWDWRSAGVAGAIEVVADLGPLWATKPVQGFILEHMNLTAGAAVELGGHATDPTGLAHTTYEAPITVTAAMIAAKRIAVELPAAETFRWWRLIVADAGNPDGYLSASRVYVGPVFTGKYHYRAGSGRDRVDLSTVGRSTGGQKTASKQAKYDTQNLLITMHGQADVGGYDDIDAECGVSRPLWIALDSSDPAGTTVYVSFARTISRPTKTSELPWAAVLAIEEEL